MTNDNDRDPRPTYSKAMFRYIVLSKVLAAEERGVVRPCAIEAVAAEIHKDAYGHTLTVSARTIYRWLKDTEKHDFPALPTTGSKKRKSPILDEKLLAYLKQEKLDDPHASIPELIKRAVGEGLLQHAGEVDRSTVWRALKAAGISTRRGRKSKKLACRRFAYPHRMNMVLCDGKHFRVGPGRARRVVLFFIDDATRMLLTAVVGTRENTALFLRGLHDCISRYGLMKAMFVDNGSGFTGHDSINVLKALGVLFIHGTAGYPEGRGKAERFNQTAWQALLRRFSGNPEIDPSCAALEHLLQHYVFQVYNHEPHAGIGGQTPCQRFHEDSAPLDYFENQDKLDQKFVLSVERTVSKDHVVSLNGVLYEVPEGYARQVVSLYRNLLSGRISMIHEQRSITLGLLDEHKNARRPSRSGTASGVESAAPDYPARMTSTEKDYQKKVPSLVDNHGNCFESEEENNE